MSARPGILFKHITSSHTSSSCNITSSLTTALATLSNVRWSQYITNYVTDLDTQLTSNNCVCVPFALIWYLVYSWPLVTIKRWSHIMCDWVTIVFLSLFGEKNISCNNLPCKACPYCTRYPPPPRAIWSWAHPWTGTRSSVSTPSLIVSLSLLCLLLTRHVKHWENTTPGHYRLAGSDTAHMFTLWLPDTNWVLSIPSSSSPWPHPTTHFTNDILVTHAH